MRATDIGEINWVLLIVSWRLKLRLLTLIHLLDIFATGVCETLAGFCQNSTGVPLIATKTWNGICIFLWNSLKSNTFIYPIWNHIWNKKIARLKKLCRFLIPEVSRLHTAGRVCHVGQSKKFKTCEPLKTMSSIFIKSIYDS